jgi:hypothetical protein
MWEEDQRKFFIFSDEDSSIAVVDDQLEENASSSFTDD